MKLSKRKIQKIMKSKNQSRRARTGGKSSKGKSGKKFALKSRTQYGARRSRRKASINLRMRSIKSNQGGGEGSDVNLTPKQVDAVANKVDQLVPAVDNSVSIGAKVNDSTEAVSFNVNTRDDLRKFINLLAGEISSELSQNMNIEFGKIKDELRNEFRDISSPRDEAEDDVEKDVVSDDNSNVDEVESEVKPEVEPEPEVKPEVEPEPEPEPEVEPGVEPEVDEVSQNVDEVKGGNRRKYLTKKSMSPSNGGYRSRRKRN